MDENGARLTQSHAPFGYHFLRGSLIVDGLWLSESGEANVLD